jgi:hypothetical protein
MLLARLAGGPRAVDTALQENIRTTKAAWLAQWMPKLTATETPRLSGWTLEYLSLLAPGWGIAGLPHASASSWHGYCLR